MRNNHQGIRQKIQFYVSNRWTTKSFLLPQYWIVVVVEGFALIRIVAGKVIEILSRWNGWSRLQNRECNRVCHKGTLLKKVQEVFFAIQDFKVIISFMHGKCLLKKCKEKSKRGGDYSAALTEKSIACPDNTGDDMISSQVNLPSSPKQHKGLMQGKNCK